MSGSGASRPAVLGAPVVLEPLAELRAAITASLASVATSPERGADHDGEVEPVPVVVLGPNEPLESMADARSAGAAVLVLAHPGAGERLAASLSRSASDAMIWPGGTGELSIRVSAAAERARTARALETERLDARGLLALSEALLSTRDIEATLFQIARRMAEVMKSERCSIVLLDEDQPDLGYVVAASDDATVRNHPIPVGTGYPEILEVMRTCAPLVIADTGRDPILGGVGELIRKKGVASIALFPVILDGRVQGVLHLRGADVRTTGFSDRQLVFATIVANVTAMSVKNARVFQSIRERTERVVSARIRAERRIKQLEKYQRFFDLAGDGLIIVDGRGRILFANREAQALLGFDAQSITQIGLHDIVDPKGLATLEDLIAGFHTGKHRRRIDLPIVSSSGEVRILSLSTASLDSDSRDSLAPTSDPVHTSYPAPSDPVPASEVAAIISCRDVTDVRQMQHELQSTKDFLENLVESSADAILAADRRGRIMVFNGSAERITGYRREEVIGRMNISKLYPPGVAQEIMQNLRSGGRGRFASMRQELITRDGLRVPISLAAALIYESGREIASVGIFSDLRDRIRMEERLADAQQKLEMSERQTAIVELAGTAAHELSQPLTTILGLAELMSRKLPPDSPVQEVLGRILSECDRMEAIVRKIGQITRYETKTYVGRTKILDLDAASGSGGKR